jgi:hypothetical protein
MAPGDEYQRTQADAHKLAAGGVVAIVAADAAPAKRRKVKAKAR